MTSYLVNREAYLVGEILGEVAHYMAMPYSARWQSTIQYLRYLDILFFICEF